jgi:hypothetical protein
MKFPTGKLVSTPAALETLSRAGVSPLDLVRRHQSGDWGDLDDEDKQANDEALLDGSRIFSAFVLPTTGEKVWVITEADRSSTCCLLPSDY